MNFMTQTVTPIDEEGFYLLKWIIDKLKGLKINIHKGLAFALFHQRILLNVVPSEGYI